MCNWKTAFRASNGILRVNEKGLVFKEQVRDNVYQRDTIPFDFLAEKGFGKIEIVKVKRQMVTIEVPTHGGRTKKITRLEPVKNSDGTYVMESTGSRDIPGAKGGKVLRILDLFPIPHGDMLKLNQASEPKCWLPATKVLVKLSVRKKTFFYEVVPNDRNLAAQMSNLAGK